MHYPLRAGLAAIILVAGVAGMAHAQERVPGESVETLLDYAQKHNPEYASMRLEADAAGERVAPAGALPDPTFRVTWMDITKMGDQSPTLAPNRTGGTGYRIMQDVPWFGKRDLKREIAELEAKSAQGRAQGTWADLSSRIKSAYAQLYYIHRNQQLSREILDLMVQLEKVAQTRYAGGLAAQQDVIRAQVEQTTIKSELIMLDNECTMTEAKLNALLARPAQAPLARPERLRVLPSAAKLEYAALEERVRLRNPQLAVEDSRFKAAEKSRDLAYKNRYPDFSVGVTPTQYGGSIREWEVMLQFNIPLQQSSRRAQEREAEAMLSAAKTRKEAASNMVLSDLSGSIAALEAARRVENLSSNSLLPQAELTFKAAMVGYQNGKVDFATLMDAQRQIRMARQNQIKAQAEAQSRLADIERLIGDNL